VTAFVVGLTGPMGAGKSTVAGDLRTLYDEWAKESEKSE